MLTTELPIQDLETLQLWGWRPDGDSLVGEYQTDYGNFAGMITREQGAWQFHIQNCPQQVLIGKHRYCFRPRRGPTGQTRHWIHFTTPNVEPISGILAINGVLQEAMSESPVNGPSRYRC